MLLNDPGDVRDLVRREATIPRYLNERQPDLGTLPVALHVNVRRLSAIGGMEVESVRTLPKDGGHIA